jgi:hypothetical protein
MKNLKFHTLRPRAFVVANDKDERLLIYDGIKILYINKEKIYLDFQYWNYRKAVPARNEFLKCKSKDVTNRILKNIYLFDSLNGVNND